MSNLATHEAEQAAITAAHVPENPHDIAQGIIDTISQSDDSNVRRAARSFQTVAPSYDDDTLSTGIADLITDMRHLCDLAGFEWEGIMATVKRQYADELAACGGPASHPELAASIKHHLE
jgi:hypothetical protein